MTAHTIKIIAEEIYPVVSEIQEYLHQNPELSFHENNTSLYVAEKLKAIGLIPIDIYAKNSVVAIIEGNGKKQGIKPCIALRADIDALPIAENNDHKVCSHNKGVMHACGHDIHTASLLGTAMILNKLKDQFYGKILLIFQPAEEKLPGGAKTLIENGLLKDFCPDVILGQHVQPMMPTGSFGFKSGEYMASTDEIYINFSGAGGHAATPEITSNTVLALAQFIAEAQVLFNNLRPKDKPAVLSFGKLEAAGATNIIPDSAKAEGTMRCFDEQFRLDIKNNLARLANTIATRHKCKAALTIADGYPCVINHPKYTEFAIEAAIELAGSKQVLQLEQRLTAEDFGYFSQAIPAVFYRMGISGNGKGEINLHNSGFDHDPKALLHSTSIMAWLALELLKIQNNTA